MRRAHCYAAGAALGAGALALGLVVRFGPAVGLAFALAVPSAELWLQRLLEAPVREEVVIPGDGRPLRADLYRPARPRGALVLVHGLSRAGRRHPELMRLSRLLAERGHLVLVPQLEGLVAFRLSGREVDEIRTALHHLNHVGRPVAVGIAGFSFGAGPALLAAASGPEPSLAGSFGGYADLRHVVTYVTTGVHAFGGRRYVHRQEEYNRWKLLRLLAGFVVNPADRGLLETMAERKLANPLEATDRLEAVLGEEGRSVLAVAVNRREDAVAPLLDRLPARARQALDDLSPLAVVPRLSGRLLIAHGAGDESIPFTESLRLAEAAGGRARIAILETFHHTGPQPFWQSASQGARDSWNLFRLVDDLLAAR